MASVFVVPVTDRSGHYLEQETLDAASLLREHCAEFDLPNNTSITTPSFTDGDSLTGEHYHRAAAALATDLRRLRKATHYLEPRCSGSSVLTRLFLDCAVGLTRIDLEQLVELSSDRNTGLRADIMAEIEHFTVQAEQTKLIVKALSPLRNHSSAFDRVMLKQIATELAEGCLSQASLRTIHRKAPSVTAEQIPWPIDPDKSLNEQIHWCLGLAQAWQSTMKVIEESAKWNWTINDVRRRRPRTKDAGGQWYSRQQQHLRKNHKSPTPLQRTALDKWFPQWRVMKPTPKDQSYAETLIDTWKREHRFNNEWGWAQKARDWAKEVIEAPIEGKVWAEFIRKIDESGLPWREIAISPTDM